MAISKILINGETIFVEVQEGELAATTGVKHSTSLPPGAQPVTAAEDLEKAAKALRSTISSVGQLLVDSAKAIGPDELSIEFSVALKGEAQPIPIIVKASTEASFKITLSWKK